MKKYKNAEDVMSYTRTGVQYARLERKEMHSRRVESGSMWGSLHVPSMKGAKSTKRIDKINRKRAIR